MPRREKETVKWFNNSRSFDFIQRDHGEEAKKEELKKAMKYEAKKIVKKDVEALNVELLQKILSGNFDQTKIQELLDQGASPTKKYLYREKQPTTALTAALSEWADQGFVPNTPVDEVCSQLKRYAEKFPAAQECASPSWGESYSYLFGEESPSDSVPSDKVAAIKKILVDIYQLLNSVEKCIPLFEIIEKELIKEWAKTHSGPIPKLEEKEYQVQCHDRTLYPIPRDEYKKTCFSKKNSVLQRTLYRMMHDTGLVKIPPQKWSQGVPRGKSKEYLRQNVFFVEDRSHPTGLLHGKLSHNIQRLLIYLAIKQNLVDIHVGNFHITMEELFSSLMDKQYANQHTKSLLWVRLLDTRMFPYVTLTDPYRVHSFLMTSSKRDQFRLLSDCMIHSFCNGVVEISEILKRYHEEANWTPQKVWDRILSCMSTQLFFNFRLTRESKKSDTPVISKSKLGETPYIISEKDYTYKEDSKEQITEPSAYVKVEPIAEELQLRQAPIEYSKEKKSASDSKKEKEMSPSKTFDEEKQTGNLRITSLIYASLFPRWTPKDLPSDLTREMKLQIEGARQRFIK